jgi:biopolymer transport protein ExbD
MITRRMLKPEITFVNLIDVTMVLLIIFMITAPTITNWIDVKLPSGATSKTSITEGIVITVSKDGAVYYEQEKIPSGKFESRFTEIWKQHTGEAVYIRGDEKVFYGNIMDIISIVKNIGGENVGLVVEEKPKTAQK